MKDYLSVSEMAEIHNISRQTLIYYDKIGLFTPVQIDSKGYRYYSPYQIPFLREICFLKSVGIKLDDIKDHIKNRNLTTSISLLEYHKDIMDKEISRLASIQEAIQDRINLYTSADLYKEELYIPSLEVFPERKVIFFPFANKICREELHLTLMQAWNTLINHGLLPSEGFGTIILKTSLEKDNIFEGAGSYVTLPASASLTENVITLPAGQYVCMYKYGMPYESDFLFHLMDWIKSNNYRITGDIIDACLLDTTFYEEKNSVDFAQLQIPIEKIK
ncbi:MAG: MerR family transcriptional regulator [Eubacteriaceae bacterium]|nr:MerR family transcriptional regulator [Eubacteriaceae bacterium]